MLLVLGVLLWSASHLFVALGRGQRQRLIERFGAQPYRGLFALTIVVSVVLIVLGWRSMTPVALYAPPAGMRHATLLLMPFAVILFTASRAPTDLKRWIRHPQLTGVKLWAVAHLLSNGDSRSLILFGGLLAWAVAEVIVINRRDGAWARPAPAGTAKTVVSTLIALAITGVLLFAHPWFTGMPVLGRS